MRYVTKEMNGEEMFSGVLTIDDIPDVPTHGSISINVYEGVWLNIKTSEWITTTFSNQPEGWEIDD